MKRVDDYKRIGSIEANSSLDKGMYDVSIYSKSGHEKHVRVSERIYAKIINRFYFGHK